MSISGFNGVPMFTGTMHDYTRTTTLKMKFEQKKENPHLQEVGEEKTEQQRQIEQFTEDMEKIREGNKIGNLDTKLMSGGELTSEELEYLKYKNPELYQKAIEIKQEREYYKKELKNCQTKEDVDKVLAQKIQGFMSQVQMVRSNPNITDGSKQHEVLGKLSAVLSEHRGFINTKEYRDLPTEQEAREGKKRKNGHNLNNRQAIVSFNRVKTPLHQSLEAMGIMADLDWKSADIPTKSAGKIVTKTATKSARKSIDLNV